MAFWIIKGPKGEHLHQVQTGGNEKPLRDCPDGHTFIRVTCHSHDPRERYDEAAQRWMPCPMRAAAHAERERISAERQIAAMSDEVLDLIISRVITKLDGGN